MSLRSADGAVVREVGMQVSQSHDGRSKFLTAEAPAVNVKKVEIIQNGRVLAFREASVRRYRAPPAG